MDALVDFSEREESISIWVPLRKNCVPLRLVFRCLLSNTLKSSLTRVHPFTTQIRQTFTFCVGRELAMDPQFGAAIVEMRWTTKNTSVEGYPPHFDT
jgi:hypothetical protein